MRSLLIAAAALFATPTPNADACGGYGVFEPRSLELDVVKATRAHRAWAAQHGVRGDVQVLRISGTHVELITVHGKRVVTLVKRGNELRGRYDAAPKAAILRRGMLQLVLERDERAFTATLGAHSA